MADESRGKEQLERGRGADKPHQIPKPGWKDIIKRTLNDLTRDHCTIVAAGVAFYILIGIVPGIAALISIYGLVANPAQIQQQFASMKSMMPAGAYQLLSQQMQTIASSPKTAGWGAAIGIVLALWSGSSATKALIEGLNISYHEEEKRNFVKLNATALLLTGAGVIGAAIMVGLITVLPGVVRALAGSGAAEVWAKVVRWPLLLVVFMTAIALLYRYAPSREKPKWKWVSWGAVSATLLWLAASALFSLYTSHFGSYNKTYGALATVVILLMWFYISAYCVLFGAELNSEMERQTARDTTSGRPEPMGRRGAFSADTLGEAQQ